MTMAIQEAQGGIAINSRRVENRCVVWRGDLWLLGML